MKKSSVYFLIISLALFACQLNAQDAINKQVYQTVEKMPTFPGGETKLANYLKSNIKYPADARKNKLSGTVMVSFVVDENGTISNALPIKEVEGDIEHSLAKEAIRVVYNMPKWTPGKEKGKAVSVQYNLPVRFELK